jgi:hypothetical protein
VPSIACSGRWSDRGIPSRSPHPEPR